MAKLSNAHAQDHGGTVPDSQEQVKALHEFFKGPKGYDKEVAKFREKVEVDQQELRALLQQRLRQAEKRNARRREDIVALLSRAFQPRRSSEHHDDSYDDNNDDDGDTAFPAYPGTRIALNGIEEAASEIIGKSKSLIRDYDQMEELLNEVRGAQLEKLDSQNCEQEVKETERILTLGRNKAVRNVGRVLGIERLGGGGGLGKEEVAVAAVGAGAAPRDGDVDGAEGEVEDDGEELNMELLRTLEYAERGVKRMVKGIPREEVDA